MLVGLLRVAGVVLVTAFLAVFIPIEWMATNHRWLGMGEFPRAPLVDYLARSIAALYGVHGILVLLVSTNPPRYRVIVSYLVCTNVLFGLILLGIDLHAGMPLLWTALEGPSIAAFWLLIGVLNRRQPVPVR